MTTEPADRVLFPDEDGTPAETVADIVACSSLDTGGRDMPEFEIAQVFDATANDGTAVMGPGHLRLADPEERERLLRYLRGAPMALYTLERDDDRFQTSRGRVVPMSFHTDGTWVWSEALSYYLENYAFAPEPALRRHIEANDYRVPEVAEDVLLAAGRVFEH